MQSTVSDAIVIRAAVRTDGPALVRLITALAEFEKLPPPDEGARARLMEDGFGNHPRFESLLAFAPGRPEPVGYAVLFETYSTFLARPSLYLEDLFVLPEFRRQGIGSRLLETCVRLADERGCGRMEWTCLDWNINAQAKYKTFGARKMSEWLLYRLNLEGKAKG